jgi:hypothetical protein
VLLSAAFSSSARADWSYELGYRFTHVEGAAPAGMSYNADLQGVHLAFREAVGGWRGELAGGYQVGSADVEAPGQTLDTSDETAWEAEYRIGPEITPNVWAFGGLAHRRWDSDAQNGDLERRFTYSPVGLAVASPAAWQVAGELLLEYWAVWNVEVESTAASGALPDAGSGWRVAASLTWPYGDGQSLLVNPYYADWELDGGLAANSVDAQTVGINLGLRWR